MLRSKILLKKGGLMYRLPGLAADRASSEYRRCCAGRNRDDRAVGRAGGCESRNRRCETSGGAKM